MAITRSRGSEATAWRSALPEWPFGIEAEILVELLQARAQDRHFLRRNAQRFAGPQARVDADPGDLALFLDRNDDQVERDPAMDGRLALGLGHERHFAALLEIVHRAEAAAFVGRGAGDAKDAERLGWRRIGSLDLVAEQGHCMVGEPVEKRAAFLIGLGRVGAHPTLQLFPVADREPDVAEHPAKVGGELLPAAGVGAVELQIHHRFAAILVAAQGLDPL